MTPLLPILVAALSAAAPSKRPAAPARVERQASGGELLERAGADMARIRKGLREVLERVGDAREERDLVKLLCADEKLARLKALVAVAERAEMALTEAVATGDDGAAVESAKITVARGKADALRAEAAGCIGQLAFEVNDATMVHVEEADDLPAAAAAPSAIPFPGDPERDPSPLRLPSAARQ